MIICRTMDPEPVKKEFLQAMRGITSTVTVVSAKNGENKQAMTATSVASLSLDPPSMLVCINHEASIHEVMKEGLGFCINILSLGQENLANICSVKEKEEQRKEREFIGKRDKQGRSEVEGEDTVTNGKEEDGEERRNNDRRESQNGGGEIYERKRAKEL